jgi:hypothetical protein
VVVRGQKMIKRTLVFIIAIMVFSTELQAKDLEVISIDRDFKWTILEDLHTGKRYQAKLEETVSVWTLRGITKEYVTVSRLHNGYILMIRLPVPDSDTSDINSIKH